MHQAAPENLPQESEIRSLSELMADMVAELPSDNISVGALLEAFHERGFGLLLLFFAAPMALPVPVPPGINILLASPLVLLTAQQALGRHTIWVPEGMKSKTLSTSKIRTLFSKIIPLIKKLEFLIKPRLGFITLDGPSRLAGLLGVIMALTVCIPVPLTNTIPSFGIALMAVGVIMRDGLAVLTGAVIGTLWVAILATAVMFFGAEAFDIIKETIKSFV